MTFSGLKKHALELSAASGLPVLRPSHQRRGLQRALEQRADLLFARLRRLDERDVAELAPGPRLLAVEVQVRARDGEHVRGARQRRRSG